MSKFVTSGTLAEIVARYESLRDVAATSDFGPFDDNLVVIDTETTGLSFKNDELTQIGAIKISGGKEAGRFVTFVNPMQPISKDIERLTGISNEDVWDAPTAPEALGQLSEFVGDAIIVAHNAAFDKHFCTRHASGFALLQNTWVDSLDLARIALPRLRGHRLHDLEAAFQVELSHHRADDDAAATAVVLRYILAGISVMPPELVEAIANMAEPSSWPTVEVFKYFAQRNADKLGRVDKLSIRKMRESRVCKVELKSKADAFDEKENPALTITMPTEAEVAHAFTAEGLVGALYENYETRVEQQQMALSVRNAFANSKNLIVEAGTGVGKSMAYLVPAAFAAKENNVTVGVATKTNALLDQLIYHELPLLSEALGGLTYASLKGFSHYACLLKMSRLLEYGTQRFESETGPSPAASLAVLLSFVEQTHYGDIDQIRLNPHALPRFAYTTTSNECLRRKCPFYGCGCYVHGARKAAAAADIVVTNHTMLFCDVVAQGGLLPPIRHWIVDEAHGAEEEARREFSHTISAEELKTLAEGLESESPKHNVFVKTERRVSAAAADADATLFYALTSKAKSAGHEFARAATDLYTSMKQDLLYFKPETGSKGYDYFDIWINQEVRKNSHFANVQAYADVCVRAAERLITESQNLVSYLEDAQGAAEVQREIASLSLTLKELTNTCAIIFGTADDKYAYSASLCKKKDKNVETLDAMLLNVGPELQERFYSNVLSVVYASATLTVGGSFDAFQDAVGLNTDSTFVADTLCVASSFDFDNNMVIYVPTDMPEPTEADYKDKLRYLLYEAHVALGGSILTLFTNRKDLEECYDKLEGKLDEAGLRLEAQKWGKSTKNLCDEFIEDKHLSLFALKSFWEGFDAPGDTLRGVIIPKLPFSKPTDPLSRERELRDSAAWAHYVLPAAVIETKQAVGRLIRSSSDRGIVILADKRLLTKNYGEKFLRSMPSLTICKDRTIRGIVEELKLMHRD